MHQSKLVTLLKKLSPKEIKELGLLIESPFFNKNQKVSDMFSELKSTYPSFSSAKISKERIFKKLYPDKKKFSEKILSYLISDIQKLCEQYFIHTSLDKREGWANFLLLDKLSELDAEKSYTSALKDANSYNNKNPFKDAWHHYDNFLYYSVENEQYYRQRKHAYDENLQMAIDNLDTFYLSTKLKYSCEIANRRNIINEKYEFRMLDEILKYLENNPSEDIPAIRIYFQILLTLIDGTNESHFETLKELLLSNVDQFSIKESRDMYAYAQNYCIKMSNEGNPKYLHELFDLYVTSLEKGILLDGRFISPFSYKNITTLAIRIHKFEWAEQFIEEYKDRVRIKFRENAYTYNLAMLHFARKNLNDALNLLNSVEFTDIVYNVGAKSLLLRIYYESKEWEALYYLIDSFKMFLKRNKLISASQRRQFNNLLKYTRKLMRLHKGDKEKLHNFRLEIESNKQVAYSSWLKEKLDELA